MIRLLHVIPTLDRSGAEKQLVLLASHLARERFDQHVAVLTRSGPLAAELNAAGIPWTLIGKSWKGDPLAFWRLTRLMRRWRPDIVHTWLFAANAYGRAAAMACSVPNINIIAAERCVDPWKREWHHTIDRFLAPRTSRFVTNSRGVCDFYAKHGIVTDRFSIIPNAIVPSSRATELQREERRAVLLRDLSIVPLPADRNYFPITDSTSQNSPPPLMLVATTARLWQQKRLTDLFWIAELAIYSQADIHFVVFGDGPDRESLLRQRDERLLARRIHFVGHRDDVTEWLPAFDIFLLPSAYEGQSNAILEAMAAGLPVIATAISGNEELVTDKKTGLLVAESRDTQVRQRALGIAVLRLYEDATLRTQLGTAAQEHTTAAWSLEAMVDRYESIYDSVMRDSAVIP